MPLASLIEGGGTANAVTEGVSCDTIEYTYDTRGNILQKTYSLDNTVVDTITYGYNNATWKDRLTSYNGVTITNDAIGNPLSWYDGATMTWQRGRQLATHTKNGTTISFAYNADGIRTSKTVGNTTTNYSIVDGTLRRMSDGTNTLQFVYGNSLSSVIFNGTEYWYVFNAQGDVIGLIDASGVYVVEYTYDSWGKPLSKTGSLVDTLGTINPFRYRGYIYDEESGFYYVSSRYYDPAVGRWLNADNEIAGIGEGTQGYNLFAYCFNNPVNMDDPSGNWPKWSNLSRGSVWLAVGITAVCVGVSVLTCGVATPAMMAVAAVTVGAGILTAVNGAAEIGEAFTGYNVVRDTVFSGNQKAYDTYANTTAVVAEAGTAVCGGWTAKNAPRIEAYNNVQNYQYADGAAKHIGQRPYYDSTLLQKQIIKYGRMANEGNGVYTFRVAGSSFNATRQLMHKGTWELTTINSMKLIGHFLLDY